MLGNCVLTNLVVRRYRGAEEALEAVLDMMRTRHVFLTTREGVDRMCSPDKSATNASTGGAVGRAAATLYCSGYLRSNGTIAPKNITANPSTSYSWVPPVPPTPGPYRRPDYSGGADSTPNLGTASRARHV